MTMNQQNQPDPTPIFTATEREAIEQTSYPAPAQVAPAIKQGRDKAVYVRQQKGHSLTKHLLFGWIVLWIPTIYYTFSPNHYWHA